ncbi:MAG: hypothetical protein AAFN80_00640 [Pseudomonadota bacterium]
MRLKAISALTVFTTAMIMAFADGQTAEPGLPVPDAVGDARELGASDARLAT